MKDKINGVLNIKKNLDPSLQLSSKNIVLYILKIMRKVFYGKTISIKDIFQIPAVVHNDGTGRLQSVKER